MKRKILAVLCAVVTIVAVGVGVADSQTPPAGKGGIAYDGNSLPLLRMSKTETIRMTVLNRQSVKWKVDIENNTHPVAVTGLTHSSHIPWTTNKTIEFVINPISGLDHHYTYVLTVVADGKVLQYRYPLPDYNEAFYTETPIAQDDFATTVKNKPVTIPVAANDVWNNLDTWYLVAPFDTDEWYHGDLPANGTVTYSTDRKKFIYTPKTGFVGTDKFTYTIEQDNFGWSWATVTVTVKAA